MKANECNNQSISTIRIIYVQYVLLKVTNLALMYKHQVKIVLITLQLAAFVTGQIIIPIISLTSGTPHLLISIIISLGIALVLQLAQLHFIENRCWFFWRAQHRFLIGYSLTAAILFFEYQWAQIYIQIYDNDSTNLTEGRVFLFVWYIFLSMNYSLACTEDYFTMGSFVVYEISAVAWVLVQTYSLWIVIGNSDPEIKPTDIAISNQLNNVSLAIQSLVIGIALFVMQELRESYLHYKRQASSKVEHTNQMVSVLSQKKQIEVELIE